MLLILRKRFYLVITVLLIVLSDQLSKLVIVNNIETLINKNFLFFSINYVENYGAAFNFFNDNRLFLSFISLLSSLIFSYLIFFVKNIRISDRYGLSFILGGSIGNGIDRIINGFVVDFININFISFPVFNIADISINIGFLILVITIFKGDNNKWLLF